MDGGHGNRDVARAAVVRVPLVTAHLAQGGAIHGEIVDAASGPGGLHLCLARVVDRGTRDLAFVPASAIIALIVHDADGLRASCPDGVLVAGGCTPNSFPDDDISIVRAGFAPDNRDEWLCSFANLHTTITYEIMSLAFCLHEEPLPAECGCCPSLADSLTIKQIPEPLRFGANRLQVQCDPGQFLVLGNCMIDVPSAADIADVTMFRFGFPPTAEYPDGDQSTWGCSWYNPTGNTPQAIATAMCLPAE
jgi:hypothetical protein